MLQTNAKVEEGRNHLRAERAQSRLQTKFNKRARARAPHVDLGKNGIEVC